MRHATRLLLVAGAVGIALYFGRASPRDVVLVYGLGDRPVSSLEVEVVRGAEVLRRAELRPGPGAAGSLRHPLRLQDGDYLLRLRIAPAEGPAFRVERPITVSESGTIVLPLQ